MTRLPLRLLVLVVVAALVAGACSDDTGDDSASSDTTTSAPTSTVGSGSEPGAGGPGTSTSEPATTTTEPVDTLGALVAEAPDGLDFYTPPDPLPGETGDIIWTREHGPVDGGTAHLVLYRSESVQGDPIAVSGLVFVPDLEAPPEGRPVFSWGNGTRGIADQCANSREDDPTASIPILTGLLERNVVVVATDYEGLGTPGVHPYVIGAAEGKGVLDAARATLGFSPAQARNLVMVGGQSQGGHAQAFANQMAADYAPELELVGSLGTSAGVVDVSSGFVEVLLGIDQFRYIMVMTMVAQEAAYGADVAPPTRLLTDFGVEQMEAIHEMCASELGDHFGQWTQEELFVEDWTLDLTDGRSAADLNQPGLAPNSAPQFLIHTRDDSLIAPSAVVGYLEKACEFGVPIGIEWWDGGHPLIYQSTEAQERALHWVDAVVAGEAPVDDCPDFPLPTDPAE